MEHMRIYNIKIEFTLEEVYDSEKIDELLEKLFTKIKSYFSKPEFVRVRTSVWTVTKKSINENDEIVSATTFSAKITPQYTPVPNLGKEFMDDIASYIKNEISELAVWSITVDMLCNPPKMP